MPDRPITRRPPASSLDLAVAPAAVDGPAPDGLDLLLQRASMPVDRDPVPAMAHTAPGPTTVDRGTGEYQPASPASHDHDPVDNAELADAIYERVERRLRAELFRDLERRGHLSEWG